AVVACELPHDRLVGRALLRLRAEQLGQELLGIVVERFTRVLLDDELRLEVSEPLPLEPREGRLPIVQSLPGEVREPSLERLARLRLEVSGDRVAHRPRSECHHHLSLRMERCLTKLKGAASGPIGHLRHVSATGREGARRCRHPSRSGWRTRLRGGSSCCRRRARRSWPTVTRCGSSARTTGCGTSRRARRWRSCSRSPACSRSCSGTPTCSSTAGSPPPSCPCWVPSARSPSRSGRICSPTRATPCPPTSTRRYSLSGGPPSSRGGSTHDRRSAAARTRGSSRATRASRRSASSDRCDSRRSSRRTSTPVATTRAATSPTNRTTSGNAAP